MRNTVKLLAITGGVVGLIYSLFIAFLGFYTGGDFSLPQGDLLESKALPILLFGVLGAAGGLLAIIGGVRLKGVSSGISMLTGGLICGYVIISKSFNTAFIVIGVCVSAILISGAILSFIHTSDEEAPEQTRKRNEISLIYGIVSVVVNTDEVNVKKNNVLSDLVRNVLYCRAKGNELYAIDIENNMIIIDTETADIILKTKDAAKLTSVQSAVFSDLNGFEDFNYVYES